MSSLQAPIKFVPLSDLNCLTGHADIETFLRFLLLLKTFLNLLEEDIDSVDSHRSLGVLLWYINK